MVEHYSPRPMSRRARVRHDDELMHYGIKGMKKGVRKDRNKKGPGVGPLKNTYEEKIRYRNDGILLDRDSIKVIGKNPYGSGEVGGYTHIKPSRLLKNIGKDLVGHTKLRAKIYSNEFKKRAKEMRNKVRSFFGKSQKQLTR